MSLPFLQPYFGLSNSLQTAQGGTGDSVTRGVFAGGYGGSYSLVMDYITIATTGNATNFGNLTVARYSPAGVQNGL